MQDCHRAIVGAYRYFAIADGAALADDHDFHLAGILHLVFDAVGDVVGEHRGAALRPPLPAPP